MTDRHLEEAGQAASQDQPAEASRQAGGQPGNKRGSPPARQRAGQPAGTATQSSEAVGQPAKAAVDPVASQQPHSANQ